MTQEGFEIKIYKYLVINFLTIINLQKWEEN